MPLSTLVAIVLRLYAIHWMVSRFGFLIKSLPEHEVKNGTMIYVVMPLLTILLAVAFYLLADKIARLVTRGLDCEVGLGGLSTSELYSIAFTGLGLYFMLTASGGAVHWIYQSYQAMQGVTVHNEVFGWTLIRQVNYLITFIAGFLCLFFAPQLARGVEKMQRRNQTA